MRETKFGNFLAVKKVHFNYWKIWTRSNFYKIGNQNIIHLFDGVSRIINQKDPYRATHDNGIDGISTIHELKYTIDYESDNPIDNINSHSHRENIFFINIKSFLTGTRFEHDNYHSYDLREPPRQILHPNKIKTKVVNYITNDWSNIPYYPTSIEKKQMIQKYGNEQTEEIIQNNLNYANQTNNLSNNNKNNFDVAIQSFKNKYNLIQIKKMNEQNRRINSQTRIVPPGINKYSPEYAQYIAPNNRANKSANIRLGGVY